MYNFNNVKINVHSFSIELIWKKKKSKFENNLVNLVMHFL